ncbi:hypothetical protein BZG35_09025 [Brevundimonas sp. LM2]|uniref:TadE/TadG family type IV pilus assembly protein n=1 Tax=Brevundimonas sp. LM2 TaxID=1938605 RepID=UPI000983E339|nr:pilus assembly protein TadG-related protein [Brevundimonas sp. LM2]AQR61781.1 hypothetical protein BZG35_09025 [Brevundimonas sp. LM2]
MTALARRLSRDERGQVALIFALALPAMALLVAGSVDLMHVNAARERIQDIADSAALAGATELSLAISDDAAVSRAHAFVDGHVADWDRAPTVTSDIGVITRQGQRILQVRLDAHSPSFFHNLLPPGGWKYNALSQAVSVGVMPLCVLITGTTKDKVLNVKDAGQLQAPACLIHSNRDILVEGGRIAAAAVQAVTSARGMISPVAGTGAARMDDPFASLPLNQARNCLNGSRPVDKKTGPHALPPGVYCGGIKIHGDAVLTLSKGEYWFLGGHLEITENAKLVGNDVVLFFDKDSKFEFKDRARVDLDGRKTGPYAGMVMIAMRNNTQDFIITSDNVDRLLGVIYVPEATMIVEGKEDVARDSAWTVIVARMLQLKGSPSLIINANYAASDVPVPNGVGPRAGGAQLVQ